MLQLTGMKPILLIAFLALGPALADQIQALPPLTAIAARHAGAGAPTAPLTERAWLCRG